MTMTGQQADIEALIASLAEQGADVARTRKGYRVRYPDGGAQVIHLTNSDHRALANMRAEVRRHGFVWPWDPAHRASPNGTFDAYPATYRDDARPTDHNIAQIRGVMAVLDQEGGPRTMRNIIRRIEGLTGHTANSKDVGHTLYWLGYRAAPGTVQKWARGFRYDWILVPELNRAAAETLPMAVYLPAEVPSVPGPTPPLEDLYGTPAPEAIPADSPEVSDDGAAVPAEADSAAGGATAADVAERDASPDEAYELGEIAGYDRGYDEGKNAGRAEREKELEEVIMRAGGRAESELVDAMDVLDEVRAEATMLRTQLAAALDRAAAAERRLEEGEGGWWVMEPAGYSPIVEAAAPFGLEVQVRVRHRQ